MRREPLVNFTGHIDRARAIAVHADGMCIQRDGGAVNHRHFAGFQKGDQTLNGLNWVMDYRAFWPRGTN